MAAAPRHRVTACQTEGPVVPLAERKDVIAREGPRQQRDIMALPDRDDGLADSRRRQVQAGDLEDQEGLVSPAIAHLEEGRHRARHDITVVRHPKAGPAEDGQPGRVPGHELDLNDVFIAGARISTKPLSTNSGAPMMSIPS